MKNFEFETESVNLNEPINQEVGKTTIDTSIGVDLDAPSMSMLNKPENKKITFFDKLEDFAEDHPITVYGILAVLSLTIYTIVEFFKFKSKNK